MNSFFVSSFSALRWFVKSLLPALLLLDLGVLHRRAHVVAMKEALGWSAVWILLGLSFTVFVYFGYENH